MYNSANAKLLDKLSDISEITIESEISVLGELSNCYAKAITIINESTDLCTIDDISIFQEGLVGYNIGKKIDSAANKMEDFAKSKTEGNILKRIGLGLVKGLASIIVKIIRFFQRFADRKDKQTIEDNKQVISETDETMDHICSDIDSDSDVIDGIDFSEDEFGDEDIDFSDFEVTPIDDDDEYILDEKGNLVKKKKDDSVTEESYFDNVYTQLILEATQQKIKPTNKITVIKHSIRRVAESTFKVCKMQVKSIMMINEMVKSLNEIEFTNLMNDVNNELKSLVQQTSNKQFQSVKKKLFTLDRITKNMIISANTVSKLMDASINSNKFSENDTRLKNYTNNLDAAKDVKSLHEAAKGVTTSSMEYITNVDNEIDASKSNFDKVVKFMNSLQNHLSTFGNAVEKLAQQADESDDKEFVKIMNELQGDLNTYLNLLVKISVYANKSFYTMAIKLNHMLKANLNNLKSK